MKTYVIKSGSSYLTSEGTFSLDQADALRVGGTTDLRLVRLRTKSERVVANIAGTTDRLRRQFADVAQAQDR